ncbi:alpha tubulin suppressor [Vanrija albida]|uniref:Alpha tubulin suppressor n=1 Tax=Vanrija albida TaxID=181172 RepID=A0ABR3Q5G1_9TREE
MPPALFACGSNGSGQLALGHEDDVSSLTRCAFHPSCPAASDIVDLVSAASHALLLVSTESGTRLLGAGTNTHGQLGRPCALSCPAPASTFRPLSLGREAGLGDGWEPVRVAATWTTSFVVYERGLSSGREQAVVSAGSNDFGELGSSSTSGPVLLDLLKPGEHVEHLRGGQRHVIAVLSSGSGAGRTQRVVGWGACRRGELDPSGPKPTAKGKGKAPARTSPPVAIALPVPPGAKITELALGAAHSLALLSTGRVLAWGSDLKGQVGGLDAVSEATGVAATWGGSYVVAAGALWSQGANTHGQLLRSSTEARARVALDAPTTLVAGSEHVLVGTAEGLWTGGWNEHGNLGLGDQADRAELVQVPVPGKDRGLRPQPQPLPQAPWAPGDASASSAPTAYQWTQEELDHYRNTHNRVKSWRQDAAVAGSFAHVHGGRSVGAGSVAWSSTDSDVSANAPLPQYRHPLSSHAPNPSPRGASLEAAIATQRRARDASGKIQRSLSKRTPLDPSPSSHHPSAPRPVQVSRSQSRRSTPIAALAQAPSSILPQNVALPRSDHLPLSNAPTAQWSQREAYLNDALSPPLEFLSDTLPEDPMIATTERPSGLTRMGSFLSRTRSTISRRSSQESLTKAPLATAGPPSAFHKSPAVSQPPDVLVMTRSTSVRQALGSSSPAKLARSQSSSAAPKSNSRGSTQSPRPSAAAGNNGVASKPAPTAAPVLPELSFDPILPRAGLAPQVLAPAPAQELTQRNRLRRFRK